MKMILLFLFLLIGIMQLSYNDDTPTLHNSYFSVSGYITDSITAIAIDSAKVTYQDTVNGFSVRSNSLGRYYLPVGNYTKIFVQKEGYDTQSREISPNINIDSVNFCLVKK